MSKPGKWTIAASGLKKNEYAVVEGLPISIAEGPHTLKVLIQILKQCAADARRITPKNIHTELIVNIFQDIVIEVGVPVTAQGALFTESEGDNALQETRPAGDGVSVIDNGSSVIAAAAASVGDKKGIRSIEETARAEAQAKARAAARISMDAVDCGNRIAADSEKYPLTLEEGAVRFSASADEDVARKTFDRARGPERTIIYSTGERRLGGGRHVSSHLHSSEVFSLRRCRIGSSDVKGCFTIVPHADDREWQRMQELFPEVNLLAGENDNPALQVLAFAQLARIPVDVDVGLIERVASKRKRLVPIKVHNAQEIVSLRARAATCRAIRIRSRRSGGEAESAGAVAGRCTYAPLGVSPRASSQAITYKGKAGIKASQESHIWPLLVIQPQPSPRMRKVGDVICEPDPK